MRSAFPTFAALALCAVLTACRGGPTLDEARVLLRSGDPRGALDAARKASTRVAPEERVAARRFAVQAALAAGLPREAARDYQLLRRLTGREDEGLLAEVASATLRRAVGSTDAARRIRGVQAVRVLGDDPRALALLRAAGADVREEVRAAVVSEVARLSDRLQAQRQLALVARGDESPYVRRRALEELARALEAGGAAEVAEAAALAREAMREEDEDARAAGLLLLRLALPREEAARALATELTRSPEHVRCAAALELLRLDPAAARRAWAAAGLPVAASAGDADAAPLGALGLALVAHGQADGAVTAALRDVLRAHDYRARLLAVRGLRGPGGRALIAELEAALKDPVQPVRVAALDTLLAAGGPSVASRACRRALGHPDPATRQRAVSGLLTLGALAPDDVIRLLGDPALATDAAAWLGAHAGERGFQALVTTLDGGSAATTALEVLAERGDARMRERFVELLTAPAVDRAAPEVRRAAALGLARCGQAGDRSLLLAMVERAGDDADLAAASAMLAIQARLSLKTAASPAAPQ